MGGFVQAWDWQGNTATVKAGQEIWAVTEHLPYAEHLRESIYPAACHLPHQPKSQTKRSSFISDGLSGIFVNNGNLAPAMTTEKVSEIRLLHIHSGYMSLEWHCRQIY